VIDGVSNQKIASVVTGNSPLVLCYDPTNNRVYCADEAGVVTAIDGASNQAVRTIAVGINSCALVWNPVHSRTYVANYHSSTVAVLRDSMNGVKEDRTPLPLRPASYPGPTVVSGVMHLPPAAYRFPITALLDISGRDVLDLHPGANDVSRLAPGVYFVRSADSGQRKTTKIVIQR
jgi:hypothetical protein